MLVHEQAYAANQPSWASFIRSVKRLPFFELRRGQHPSESVAALRGDHRVIIASNSSIASDLTGDT